MFHVRTDVAPVTTNAGPPTSNQSPAFSNFCLAVLCHTYVEDTPTVPVWPFPSIATMLRCSVFFLHISSYYELIYLLLPSSEPT